MRPEVNFWKRTLAAWEGPVEGGAGKTSLWDSGNDPRTKWGHSKLRCGGRKRQKHASQRGYEGRSVPKRSASFSRSRTIGTWRSSQASGISCQLEIQILQALIRSKRCLTLFTYLWNVLMPDSLRCELKNQKSWRAQGSGRGSEGCSQTRFHFPAPTVHKECPREPCQSLFICVPLLESLFLHQWNTKTGAWGRLILTWGHGIQSFLDVHQVCLPSSLLSKP